MAIQLKDDTVLRKTTDTYNNLNRIESLDLLSGTGLIRIGKYWDKTHRDEAPEELLENREFVTVQLTEEDLKAIKDHIYKQVITLDKYKDGTQV